nr:Chain B, PROTEIN ENABLED HOMOLOG [Mus musculus]4CC3_D Chain D, PROTEIN ENABLED HOMOLOG [Mus musculus]4CC3_F Chain F, PROTEIN ENABLED HOMOLOG [Mus musculus]4CC3_H Chain H, PROTEIN ENABLED HOMOLOG [Mus musculus]
PPPPLPSGPAYA